MTVRRFTRVFSICALLSLVLVKFQNCAPVNPSKYAADGEVRIIDDWSQNKIEFMSPSYLVENSVQSINVQGLCVGAPKGQQVVWQLVAQDGVVETGQTECLMGSFQLNISRLRFNDCNSQLEVRAQKADSIDAPAITVLRPFCDS